MAIFQNDAMLAFKYHNPHYLHKIHLYLNENYYRIHFNPDANQALEINEWTLHKQIENTWMQHEINDCYNRYDCHQKITSITDVEVVLLNHPVNQHPLFHYLQQDASIEDLKRYILNESVLNLEFFDYLVLSLIGVSDIARAEIITNVWDEAGRGHISQFHTNQFRAVMNSLGLTYQREKIIENMSWEGLAGINLFSYLSQYSHNKMKYFGLLAATELLDPPHYFQLLRGMSKYKSSHGLDVQYYVEHESIDIQHGNSWINNVILPEVTREPQLIVEFWLGFYLRLDSVQRYYDNLLQQFVKKLAA